MIYAQPGASFEANAEWGLSGLVGQITVAVYDGIGNTSIAPHTTGIIQTAPGIYTATMTAPTAVGQYTIVWAYGGDTASDEVTVTTSVSVPIVPVPGPGMTVGQMLDEIMLDRFEQEHRPRAFKALNNRYAHLWTIEDWTWKYAQVPVTLQAQVQAASGLPQDFGVPIYVWDENTNLLPYLDTPYFQSIYGSSTPDHPEAWTVHSQQILFGPIPSSALTFSTYYRRRLIPLTDEGQTPEIPEEFSLALIHGARGEMLAFFQDPTYPDMDGQWQMDLEALRREYLADATGQPAMWSSDLAAL